MCKKMIFPVLSLIAMIFAACGSPGNTASSNTGTNETQVAMQVQLTVQSFQQGTMAAQLTQQSNQAIPQATSVPLTQPTNPPQQPPATPDIQQQIRTARILVYEDTLSYGFLWIKDTLDSMELDYTHVHDAVGDFMSNLNSGIQWDLIIVGAEAKKGVQGEFWDVISTHINGDHKTALIAEIWYLDLVGEGRIKPILTQCGITYQRDWPVAESIYWLDSGNPVFNQPNTVMPFLHYGHFWANQAGDLIKLTSGSEATLLAGTLSQEKSSYGVLASCYDGRVIFQTFSNRDFHYEDVLLLWENYIVNTLTNHFIAIH